MKGRIMDVMQRFARAMFIPLMILPIVGILIAFGRIFTNAQLLEVAPFLDHPILTGFGTILSDSLVSILNHLGLIFAVGLAIGLADKKTSQAGFSALLAYFIFIHAMNHFMDLNGMLIEATSLQETGQAMVLGVQVLDTGVFLGIILGVVTGIIHNKYADIKFNYAFQIYGGSRFVFIVLIPIIVLLAVLLSYLWPFFQSGINHLRTIIDQSGNFGLFLYGTLDRLLIPTGLHHLVYTPLLYTELGGVAEIGGEVFSGARNIYFAELAYAEGGLLEPSVIWDARGISKMFGLVGASLAMYHTAKPQNKQNARAILVPAVLTSFIAGVTEPIEFSMMFVAPLLFVVHSVLSGLSMVVLNILNVRAIGPNGIIEFILYNVPLGVERTRWPMFLLVGIVFFALYYVIFRFLIQQFNYKTIGREEEGAETKLYSKDDYQQKKGSENPSREMTELDPEAAMASTIVDALGGPENIQTLTNCYSRLRLTVVDPDKVDENTLKSETGASGVMIKDKNVQVVYGLQVEAIRRSVDKYLGRSVDSE